jgi:hypothetical protein
VEGVKEVGKERQDIGGLREAERSRRMNVSTGRGVRERWISQTICCEIDEENTGLFLWCVHILDSLFYVSATL